MHKQFISLSFLLLLCSLSSSGQDTDTIQSLQPVEVRSLRVGNNAPFVKTDVTAKDLEKLNLGQDLPFLLQYTPSAVVTSDAGTGIGYTGLRIRGTDGSRINVTLNGIPVNDGESQGVFFVDFPDISSSTGSIQLQRGVGTSTNGAGAFGAAVSVNNLTQMKEAGAEGYFSYGSFNTQRYTVKAGTGLLRHGLQFDVRLSSISSDGYVDRSAARLQSLQFLAGWKVNDRTSFRFMLMSGQEQTGQAWNGVPEEKLRGSDSALTQHYLNNIGILYFSARDSVNLFTSDRRKYNSFTYMNQTDNYQQDYYQFFADHRFSKHLTGHLGLFLTRGKGYYQEYKQAESFSSYGLPDFITPSSDTFTSTDLIRQLWLDNKYYGSVFSLLYEKNRTSITLGGALLRYEGYHYGFITWARYGVEHDYRWYHLNANKNEGSVYLKAQQTLADRLVLFGDVQYRRVHYAIHGFRKNPMLHPEADFNFFNPKLGITYLISNTATQRQKLYLSGAIASKEPNRDDFEASGAALPRPERLYDAEAGYEISKRTWNAAVNLYYMYYTDQLVLTGKVNDVGAYTRTNVPESYRTGVEQQASWQPLYWLRVSENVTLSGNKVLNFTEYIDDYDNGGQIAVAHGTSTLAFAPSAVGAFILSFEPFRNLRHHQSLGLDLYAKYVGSQYLDNTENEARMLDAYSTVDLRLRYGIAVKPFREANIMLSVNNVFNTLYESNGYTYSSFYGNRLNTQNFYFPQAGINWLAGLNLKW